MKRKTKKTQLSRIHTRIKHFKRIKNLEKANKELHWLRHGKNVANTLAKKLNMYGERFSSAKTEKGKKQNFEKYNKTLKKYLWVKEITASSKQQKEYWREKRSYQITKNKVLFRNKQFRPKHIDTSRKGTPKIDYIHNNLLDLVYDIMEKAGGDISQADAEEQAWKIAKAQGKVVDLFQNKESGVEWGYIDEDSNEIISPID